MKHLAIQATAAFAVLSLIWPYYLLRQSALPWLSTSIAIGCIAALITSICRHPWWWRLIHGLFAPLVWVGTTLPISPQWYFFAFVITLLIYRGAITGQIPLFLSNKQTIETLAKLIAPISSPRLVDLGAGTGSVIRALAQRQSTGQFIGIENAPATWLVGYLRTLRLQNCQWRFEDLWEASLADSDVVYAFLSPAPMSALWQKACQEMPAGSLLISNSFPIPEVPPSAEIDVGDARKTRLYCYRINAL